MSEPLPDSLVSIAPVLFAAVCGLLLGSFLNVCIYRIPRDLSVVTPRSFCPECGAPIASFDNLPVLSFLFLRGQCRRCRARISLRYPVVELTTALLFGLVVFQYGYSAAALKWLIFEALLVTLFWTDLETEILPDELTLGGTAVALIMTGFVPVPGIAGDLVSGGVNPVWGSFANVIAGGIFLSVPIWLTAWVFGRLVGQEALGLGDVKLLLMLGCFLGLNYGLEAFMAGTIAGALLGGVWAILKRRKPLTQTLRFGCFLSGAAAFVPLIHDVGRA